MFDDSEDEFEDDYTESIKLIKSLEEKLGQRQEDDMNNRIQDAVEKETRRIYSKARTAFDDQLKIALNRNKNRRSSKVEPNISKPSTRSSTRQSAANIDTNLNTEFDVGTNTIEILMDGINDPFEDVEFITNESTDETSEEQFLVLDSNDESNIIGFNEGIVLNGDKPHVSRSSYTIQELGEIDPSDESMEQQSLDGDGAGMYCKILDCSKFKFYFF